MCSHQVSAFRRELQASRQQEYDRLPPAQRHAWQCEEAVAAENPMLCCPLSNKLMHDPVTASDGKKKIF
jgi:hypothetical protein